MKLKLRSNKKIIRYNKFFITEIDISAFAELQMTDLYIFETNLVFFINYNKSSKETPFSYCFFDENLIIKEKEVY